MDSFILGGGVSGLAVAWASGLPLFEAEQVPGGICSSYYVRPGSQKRLSHAPEDGEAYRFELGGGHWIFGGDPVILQFIRKLGSVKTYERISSVFFPDQELYVPYPLQNHLRYVDPELRAKALEEIQSPPQASVRTMEEWLIQSFGASLTKAFFGPFHELYTAGLWKRIAPQDAYKSPVSIEAVLRGASSATAPAGYNTTYLYPQEGLNTVAQRMAARCNIQMGKRATRIDVDRKRVAFEDGTEKPYSTLISTLPLNKMIEMAGIKLPEPPDPYTSVLVLNIGAVRGPKCPNDHWIYLPQRSAKSSAGSYRIGFYSNVDSSFLPASSHALKDRVSIYIEKAYVGGSKPSKEEIAQYVTASVNELQSWNFIEAVDVADPTWIDVAYTWSWPGSKWRKSALDALEDCGIQMVGRYARWVFQGIADSIRDGFVAGAAARTAPSSDN